MPGELVWAAVTNWPTTNALPACTAKVLVPVPMVSEVVLVADVPGALIAEAALAAAAATEAVMYVTTALICAPRVTSAARKACAMLASLAWPIQRRYRYTDHR